MPFSAIGLILGVVGLVVPLVTKTRGIALPISGIAVNAVALAIVLLGQVFGFAFFSRAPVAGVNGAADSRRGRKTFRPALPCDAVRSDHGIASTRRLYWRMARRRRVQPLWKLFMDVVRRRSLRRDRSAVESADSRAPGQAGCGAGVAASILPRW